MKPINKLGGSQLDIRRSAIGKGAHTTRLGDLLNHGEIGKSCWSKNEFGKFTYRTRGLTNTLMERMEWSYKNQRNGFQRIKMSFDCGKMYFMIARHNMCRIWNATSISINSMNLYSPIQIRWGKIEQWSGGKITTLLEKVAPYSLAVLKLQEHTRLTKILKDETSHRPGSAKNVGVSHVRMPSDASAHSSNRVVKVVNFLLKFFNRDRWARCAYTVTDLPNYERVLGNECRKWMQLLISLQRQFIIIIANSYTLHIIHHSLFSTAEIYFVKYTFVNRSRTYD